MPIDTSSKLYEKLAKDIVHSSLWACDAEVCKVWVTMIALKGRDHVVTVTASGIARMCCLPLATVERCLEDLQKPDPQSGSKDHDGRRLLKVPAGFLLVNGEAYKSMGWTLEKREADRARKQASREKVDEPATATQEPAHQENARAVIKKMSELSGAKFLEVPSNIKPISARLAESGVTLEGVMEMLVRMWSNWKVATTSDGKSMKQFFRVSTLFKTAKFHDYYAQKDLPPETPNNSNKPRQSELIMSTSAPPKTVW